MSTYVKCPLLKMSTLENVNLLPLDLKEIYVYKNHKKLKGTNKKNDRQYYLDRKRITGDLHGQAPMIWCAMALVK